MKRETSVTCNKWIMNKRPNERPIKHGKQKIFTDQFNGLNVIFSQADSLSCRHNVIRRKEKKKTAIT